MSRLKFKVQGSNEEFSIDVNKIFNAGFAGSNQEFVKDHIKELGDMGIPAPNNTPSLYPISSYLATTDTCTQVQNDESTGEIEYVLIFANDKCYLTVGSDQTDRNLEIYSYPKSKQAAENIIAPEVWDYDEVKDHFEEIELECYAEKDGIRELYQKGLLGDLMRPEEWEDEMKNYKINENGNIFFSGTLNYLNEKIDFPHKYEMRMIDKKLGREIKHTYKVEFLDKGIE